VVISYLRHRRRLDEVHLQERLEVQVRHLIAVLHAEQLGQGGVREDAALERRVKARVRLDVLADELRHLRLRALRTLREAHELGQLRRQRALNQEGIVGATGLPDLLLLRGHRRRVLTLLLLGITGLTLGRLRRLLDSLDGVADTGAQLGAEGLELLGELAKLNLGRLR